MRPPKRFKGRFRRFAEDQRQIEEASQRWEEVYEAAIVEKLEWDRAYWIIRLGESEFAFTGYERYVAALGEAWGAGLAPDHGPGPVRGADLPDVAPSLRGVDIELTSQGSRGLDPETR